MPPLLAAETLTKHFPVGGWRFAGRRAMVRAVDGVSFALAAGETLGLVGESGSGKSTVARCLVRLLEPTAGRISFGGEDLAALDGEALRRRRREFQMVFQDPATSLNPRLSLRQAVGEPLRLHANMRGAALADRVAEVLDEVGLGRELLDRYPHELSGGQRQRANIARAIATRPRLVVLDEPTSALDVSLRARVVRLLAELRARLGMTYVFISHDLSTVRHLADRVAVMYLGALVEEGPARELFARPLHPYTRALLSAIPVPDPDARRERLVLQGEMPSPIDVPRGCRLRPRCPLARSVCETEVALREVAPGRRVACHLV
jgi:oligopeptide/dipeptide ABC transporter ATP-binding protein